METERIYTDGRELEKLTLCVARACGRDARRRARSDERLLHIERVSHAEHCVRAERTQTCTL